MANPCMRRAPTWIRVDISAFIVLRSQYINVLPHGEGDPVGSIDPSVHPGKRVMDETPGLSGTPKWRDRKHPRGWLQRVVNDPQVCEIAQGVGDVKVQSTNVQSGGGSRRF